MKLLPWAIAVCLLVILWDTHQPAQAETKMPARFAAPGWLAATSIAGQTYGLKTSILHNGEVYLDFYAPCGAAGGFPPEHANGCQLSGLRFCTYEDGCEGAAMYSHETDAHERMARNIVFIWETWAEDWYKTSRTISAEGGELRIGSKLPGRGDTVLVTKEMPNRIPELCDSDEERDRRAVSFLNDVLWYCGGQKGWGTTPITYGE